MKTWNGAWWTTVNLVTGWPFHGSYTSYLRRTGAFGRGGGGAATSRRYSTGAATVATSDLPHRGQVPGASERTSSSTGHAYTTADAAGRAASDAAGGRTAPPCSGGRR